MDGGSVENHKVAHKERLVLYICVCFLGGLCLQRKCIEFALKVKPQRRYIPRVRFQYKIWWFVTSRGFEYGIFILIIINTLTLAMKVGIHSVSLVLLIVTP